MGPYLIFFNNETSKNRQKTKWLLFKWIQAKRTIVILTKMFVSTTFMQKNSELAWFTIYSKLQRNLSFTHTQSVTMVNIFLSWRYTLHSYFFYLAYICQKSTQLFWFINYPPTLTHAYTLTRIEKLLSWESIIHNKVLQKLINVHNLMFTDLILVSGNTFISMEQSPSVLLQFTHL